jgi:hypothetical protein
VYHEVVANRIQLVLPVARTVQVASILRLVEGHPRSTRQPVTGLLEVLVDLGRPDRFPSLVARRKFGRIERN